VDFGLGQILATADFGIPAAARRELASYCPILSARRYQY
jgi:hypothetical protein